MADLDLLPKTESRDPATDWAIRAGITVFYVIFGLEKFSSSPDSHWALVFQQIHAGQWFRYFTGFIEISAALLVLIPSAAIFGLILLACTMLCASLIVAFVLHQPGEATFPGLLFLVLGAVAWTRRAREINS